MRVKRVNLFMAAWIWLLMCVPDGPSWPMWWSRFWVRVAEHTTPNDW